MGKQEWQRNFAVGILIGKNTVFCGPELNFMPKLRIKQEVHFKCINKIRKSFAKLFRQIFETIYKMHNYAWKNDIYRKKCIKIKLILQRLCANIVSQRNLTKLVRR